MPFFQITLTVYGCFQFMLLKAKAAVTTSRSSLYPACNELEGMHLLTGSAQAIWDASLDLTSSFVFCVQVSLTMKLLQPSLTSALRTVVEQAWSVISRAWVQHGRMCRCDLLVVVLCVLPCHQLSYLKHFLSILYVCACTCMLMHLQKRRQGCTM